jgi:hypothetical protein
MIYSISTIPPDKQASDFTKALPSAQRLQAQHLLFAFYCGSSVDSGGLKLCV